MYNVKYNFYTYTRVYIYKIIDDDDVNNKQ